MEVRNGIGFDAHRLVTGRSLVLGGVEIESEVGLAGHSDADVLCHALSDALLGAVADGDLGAHFPDTDPRWRDARSLDILRQVADIVRAHGAQTVNIDSTVIAEKPKLAPHVPAMRANIADCLQVDVGSVSVKATTVEKMGAIGREEGIAAMAVVSVRVGQE